MTALLAWLTPIAGHGPLQPRLPGRDRGRSDRDRACRLRAMRLGRRRPRVGGAQDHARRPVHAAPAAGARRGGRLPDRARPRRQGRAPADDRSRSGADRRRRRSGDDRRAGHRRLQPGPEQRLHRAIDGADRLRAAEHRRQVHRSAAGDVVRNGADATGPSVPLLRDLLQRGRRHSDRSSDGDLGTDHRHRVRLRRRSSTSAIGSSRKNFRAPGTKCRRFEAGTRRGIRCCGCRPTTTWSANPGPTAIRYAPVPTRFDLSVEAREAVMDAAPWTYAIASAEMRREGKIADDPPPGINTDRRPATLRVRRGVRHRRQRRPGSRSRHVRSAVSVVSLSPR